MALLESPSKSENDVDHGKEDMKNKALALIAAGAISIGVAMPSMAGDGPLSSMASLAGATTAVIVDTPQGIVVNSLWRTPHTLQRQLAKHFGDEKGLGQNLAAFALGWPVGMVWGVPYGAIVGAKHGMTSGWEKPFSTDSYIVTEEK